MNRRSVMTILLSAGADSLCSKLAVAAPVASDEFTIRSEVRLVLLDVSVTDKHGKTMAKVAERLASEYPNVPIEGPLHGTGGWQSRLRG